MQCTEYHFRSWDSSDSIVSDYRLDDLATGVRSPAEARGFFLQPRVSRPALRSTQPPIQWVPGSFPRGKARPERDAEHSPPLVPRSRTSRGYKSSPPYRLHGGSGTALLCITEYHFMSLTVYGTVSAIAPPQLLSRITNATKCETYLKQK
jgi:hypothetical protein